MISVIVILVTKKLASRRLEARPTADLCIDCKTLLLKFVKTSRRLIYLSNPTKKCGQKQPHFSCFYQMRIEHREWSKLFLLI